MKRKSHMSWSWIIIVSFFLLSIIDFRFGIFGFVCMTAPIYHALRGRGKVHCSHYCPRGSFLGKFLQKISFNNNMPKWMRSKLAKNALLMLMITLLTVSLIHAEGNFNKIAFSLFRFMGVSFIVGIMMGVIFKPRSWCTVCPMGHATGLINKNMKKPQKIMKKRTESSQKKKVS
ncbi:4Fe-4S binding protein [Clostridium sp. D2Q-11]|uniref:4Fe-4S binding protein n=1 Tax=Anaeromonas frigoriresistens TaxID=2683708 RepID=A0A942Z9U9_9FIRM|nr:4Fe-4S binding protein [Anaeromonas frigoriresistens]MBS4539544.1 4Fe-4S binding protein [Anaeromonas frigoriresistens]